MQGNRRVWCAGQSHDGFFEFARDGRVKHVLGTATTVDSCGVTLKDGTQLPAHMVIYCGGCEYQGSPPFLKDLKLGDPFRLVYTCWQQVGNKLLHVAFLVTQCSCLERRVCVSLRHVSEDGSGPIL